MKRVGKPVFFIVAGLILLVTALSFMGVYSWYGDVRTTWIKGAGDIRWGIDIRGGVDATFMPPEDVTPTRDDMDTAQSAIEARLIAQNIADYEVYTDYSRNRIIVRFPWKADETDFDPQAAIQELGETAMLTFREGTGTDENGLPTGAVVIQGSDIERARAAYITDQNSGNNEPVVSLKLNAVGAEKFAEATGRLVGQQISIWMDDTMISAPQVQGQITGGEAIINGMGTYEVAKDLADKINAGALPFALRTDNFSTISPTLGESSKDAMVLAGSIAFLLIAIIMIWRYRLPGMVAVIALIGQVGLMIVTITGFFPGIPSFTLTLPGIAGIILSIGFGVDANVITAERIKEEIQAGKTIDGAVNAGYKQAFSAIFDGNITVIIVAVILMGAFGPPGNAFGTLLTPFFYWFGPSTAGSIYSFGYTLLMGVVANFLMGVTASKFMLKSISRFSPFRKLWFYGGEK